MFKRLIEKY